MNFTSQIFLFGFIPICCPGNVTSLAFCDFHSFYGELNLSSVYLFSILMEGCYA